MATVVVRMQWWAPMELAVEEVAKAGAPKAGMAQDPAGAVEAETAEGMAE